MIAATSAEACPVGTELIRKAEPYAQRLPDCRAYEQVSPADKKSTDAMGQPGFVQSSSSGESVSYYSVAPFPGISGSSEFPSYLSMRTSDSWLTQGLLPLTELDAVGEVLGLTNNNNEAIEWISREEGLLLAPGAKRHKGNLYLRNDLTEEYKLIAPGVFGVTFAGATPDGSLLLFRRPSAKDKNSGELPIRILCPIFLSGTVKLGRPASSV